MVFVEDEEERVAALQKLFPGRCYEELLRFCRARPSSVDDAAAMFQDYLDWRKDQGSPDSLASAAKAIPQEYIRSSGKAKDGSPVILVQGARYDPDIEPIDYVLACAQVLDSLVSSSSTQKVTILIDCRPSKGWPNVSGHRMLPFFQLASSILAANFPERVAHIVVYPMPFIVQQLWRMVRGCLDKSTQAKFVVLSGSAAADAECPQQVGKYIDFKELPEDAQSMYLSLAA
eukprot:TRINITY_DN116537_c0_g1_i1.p1 TRINITY_DN116537_c0_g1~~TRINITY_DN116537_c0_g1_i1.p1  ORF type:complete len:253 (+),score=38.61 TRINITY_DN116537_c0_g1_i1:68-760(+)